MIFLMIGCFNVLNNGFSIKIDTGINNKNNNTINPKLSVALTNIEENIVRGNVKRNTNPAKQIFSELSFICFIIQLSQFYLFSIVGEIISLYIIIDTNKNV